MGELSSLSFLESIDVSDRALPNTKRLSAAGFGALAALASLHSLSVAMCGFADAHVAALSALTRLTRLTASYSDDLTCAGAAQLARRCPSLRHLDLMSCPYLGDAGVAALATLPALRHLALAGCHGVGAAGAAALAAGASQLTWLSMNRDTHTKGTLDALRALPRLHFLYA